MNTENADMAKSAMMTVRLTPETSEKLEALARDTKRSKAYLAAGDREYIDLNLADRPNQSGPRRR